MKKHLTKTNFFEQIGYGLTSAAIIGTFSLSIGAVLNLNLIYVLISCVDCSFFSLKLNKGIFAPSAFFIVPLVYIFSLTDVFNGALALALGSFIYLLFNRFFKNFKAPKAVIVGMGLGLSIVGTLILTNDYFGIGASGESLIEILKSYRSLGFHPNFMGLLYGTITLFTMITYPFKFKKLNKYLPAEFITILIPFILNLFLNPSSSPTAINEALIFKEALSFGFSSFKGFNFSVVLKSAFTFGVLMIVYKSLLEDDEKIYLGAANVFAVLPVLKNEIRGYSCISAFTSALICSLVIVLFPNIIARTPMHSIGAMLIVSLWRNIPYKYFKEAFKAKSFNLIITLICILSFAVTKDIFSASLIIISASFFKELIDKKKG